MNKCYDLVLWKYKEKKGQGRLVMGNPRQISNDELAVKINKRKFPRSRNVERGTV